MTDRITLELAGVYDLPDRAGQLRRYRLVQYNLNALLLDLDRLQGTTIEGWLEFQHDPNARRSLDTFTPNVDAQVTLRVVLLRKPMRVVELPIRWTSLEEHNRYQKPAFEARFRSAELNDIEITEELG